MTTISEVRATVLWHVFHSELAADAPSARSGGALPALHRAESYVAAWDAAGTPPLPERPWPVVDDRATGRNHFWEYHIGDLRSVSAKQAWRLGVPMRAVGDERIVCALPNVAVRPETFLHPFGTTLGVTLVVTGARPLAAAVDAVAAARRDPVMRWGSAPAEMRSKLTDLVDELLQRRCRERAIAAAPLPSEPMCIATVVRGAGVDPGTAVVEESEEHHALSGFCDTDAAWADLRPDPLADAAIQAKGSVGSVLYGRRRGRTVWMPHLFTLAEATRQLGCYHRNLVFLSMYLDAQLALCAWAADASDIPPPTTKPIKEAATALGRLYGFSDTYRSRSAPRQIDDFAALEAVDRARQARGLSPFRAGPGDGPGPG